MLLLLTGCHPTKTFQDRHITQEAFSDLKTPAFYLDFKAIGTLLNDMAQADRPQSEADRYTRNHYTQPLQHLLWIDRGGVDSRADSLLSWLRSVSQQGFSPQAFYVADIERDLRRMRQLDFSQPGDDAVRVAARLEYRLTKACLRYAYGQRFGFVNPQRVFNRLDPEKEDSIRHITRYRGLFDISMDLPSQDFAQEIFRKVDGDSIAEFLHEIQPQDAFYTQLQQMLKQAGNEEERRRIICNMERCRWRLKHPLQQASKRIVVNIPAFHLYAYNGDSVLDMRIACGAFKTKTPQLTSAIEWMEVNPQWVIPMSIIEKDVVRHAGDSAYFARNRYHIVEKATNQEMTVEEVSRQMLLSGNYRIAQESGSDNSLGRIVFRFKNPFSVYLHFTSSPGVFSRETRAVSHGCVRVAKPFELAHFVLDNPDEWLLDRIRISMDMKPATDRGRHYLATHRDEKEHKLIGYVPVKPHVPLYIIYFTLWPDQEGVLKTWPDVYGYDQVLWNGLKPYIF